MITAELVRSILDYNPLTGVFTWKNGTLAGGISNCGYLRIGIKRSKYLAHRLAWLMMTGKWPLDQLDHINGVRIDNRWANLRAATNAQNTINSDYANRTGLRGIYHHKKHGGWAAAIKANGHRVHLGYFKTPEEAHAAYCEAAREFHGEFARTSCAEAEHMDSDGFTEQAGGY